jgi:hypothetical protein
VRFRRKSASGDPEGTDLEPQTGEDALDDTPGAAEEALEPAGPWDESEVDVEEGQYIDLGSLLLSPGEDMEIRLQVDEQSGTVMAAVLVTEQGALELRAFAAPRGDDAWAELRPQIAAETARMGGTATEAAGPFGPELRCMLPVPLPEGGTATQPSRVMAHQGGRWLLRATLMGEPALDDDQARDWEQTIRRTVVRRGREAMAPGAPLPLRLPPEARRVN